MVGVTRPADFNRASIAVKYCVAQKNGGDFFSWLPCGNRREIKVVKELAAPKKCFALNLHRVENLFALHERVSTAIRKQELTTCTQGSPLKNAYKHAPPVPTYKSRGGIHCNRRIVRRVHSQNQTPHLVVRR